MKKEGITILTRSGLRDYLRQRDLVINLTRATLNGQEVTLHSAVFAIIGDLVLNRSKEIHFVGNGGSSAIAIEHANRYWKFCGIKSRTYYDPSVLTSTANDFGWRHVFSKPMEVHFNRGDMLVAISSSGNSPNIIDAVMEAKSKNGWIFTLTGFNEDNALRKLGDVNLYVPSDSYRHVEGAHLVLLDLIFDKVKEALEEK